MRLSNIFNLGVKELRSLRHDPVMVVLIIYSFTLAVIMAAQAMPETLPATRPSPSWTRIIRICPAALWTPSSPRYSNARH